MITPQKNRLKTVLLFSVGASAALITQLLIAAPASAECEFEGTTYQTGDTVGSYVCMPDQTWQQR